MQLKAASALQNDSRDRLLALCFGRAMNKYDLSDLIGQIYDCALDLERWSDVIGRMASAVDAAAGMVALHDLGVR